MDAGAVGIKLGVEVLRRTAPRGINWLTTYARGIEMLIVGPGGAGKTSIAEYFEYGLLEEGQAHEKTLEISKSRTFKISIGRDESLVLRVRRSVDVPGQTGPVEHANLVGERRPHAVLVVLDGGQPKDFPAWLDQFCERLDHLLRQDKRLMKKIRGFSVALNKRDTIRRELDFQARKKRVQRCLREGLGDVLGRQFAKAIPILPTIAVQTNHGTVMLDALIRKIAKQVAK